MNNDSNDGRFTIDKGSIVKVNASPSGDDYGGVYVKSPQINREEFLNNCIKCGANKNYANDIANYVFNEPRRVISEQEIQDILNRAEPPVNKRCVQRAIMNINATLHTNIKSRGATVPAPAPAPAPATATATATDTSNNMIYILIGVVFIIIVVIIGLVILFTKKKQIGGDASLNFSVSSSNILHGGLFDPVFFDDNMKMCMFAIIILFVFISMFYRYSEIIIRVILYKYSIQLNHIF